MDMESIGAGIQSAVTISIARTYADLVRHPVVVLIEEPELYLHPHACRSFYKLLKDLSGSDLQIIYATHERCFVDTLNYPNIYLVSKVNDETIVKNINTLTTSPSRELQILTKCSEEFNEIFFAKYVIITEGFADKLACRLALEKEGINIDQKNISIIDAGGSGNIYYLVELVSSFDIDCFAIYDADAISEIQRTQTLLGMSKIKIQSPDNLEGMWGISQHLEKESALTILPNWVSTHSTPQIYLDIISHL